MTTDTEPAGTHPGEAGGVSRQQLEVLTGVMHDPDGQGSDPAAALLRAVVAMVPGVDGAALTRIRAHRPSTVGSSCERAARWSRWELKSRQGPTVDALTRRTSVLVGDLAATSRWPQLRTGNPPPDGGAPRSVYSFSLRHVSPTATVMTLYSSRPHVLRRFEPEALAIVLGFAQLTMAGLAHHTRVANLERAMLPNRRIGSAMRILMTMHNYTEEEAHAALSVASQALNRKVADLALDVVLTGAIPDLSDATQS